ncbi:MAG: thioredoxin family protein [Oscillospiraceae bacterium]|nr:thioredoxin family protein [Oscillospiraceae bacterium]
MQNLTYFYFDGCPFCAQAEKWLEDIIRERPELAQVQITRINERKRPDIANKYDYYYVPTFFMDGTKLHEGAATREIVESVLQRAYGGDAQVVG